MNKRQHKKVSCQVTYKGIVISLKKYVPPRFRKAVRNWHMDVAKKTHEEQQKLLIQSAFSGYVEIPLTSRTGTWSPNIRRTTGWSRNITKSSIG